MAATGITITADMFHTLMLKKQAQVGIVVEDPFKSIYQDVKSTALTLMLPFSLPVGGMIQVGGNSGKGIGTGGADANVSWGDFTVTRLRWNRPFPVDKDVIQSDQAGIYADLPKNINYTAQAHWFQQTTNLLVNAFPSGSTPVSEIDGLSFFNSSHTLVGTGTINNYSTAALSEYSYIQATQALDSYVIYPDEFSNGLPLNQGTKKLLMIGPTQKVLARKIVDRQKGSIGEDLVLYKDAEVIVNPLLSGNYANYWFLFATGGMSKTILKWEAEPIKLLFFNEKNSMECAESNIWKYIVSLAGRVHLLYPHTCYGSTGAVAYTAGTGVNYGVDALQMKSL